MELNNPLQNQTKAQINNLQSQFQNDGYYIFPNVISSPIIQECNLRLEHVLRGQFDTGVRPDKTPKVVKVALPTSRKKNTNCIEPINNTSIEGGNFRNDGNRNENDHEDIITCENNNNNNDDKEGKDNGFGVLGFTGNRQNVKVLQVINIHKSDSYFHQLVTSPVLGELVATIMGWKDGARLAQDQVWAKPPNAPPLAYHRDSPYFMFEPHSVATVWIALDDMTPDIGPLTYVKGSHQWGEGRVGSSQNFFQSDGGMALLYSAAERANVHKQDLEFISMAELKAGGLSIHDGRTWHGSSGNQSKNKPRRGIGLHFVPCCVHWTEDAKKSRLWRKYVDGYEGNDLKDLPVDEVDFPVTWRSS